MQLYLSSYEFGNEVSFLVDWVNKSSNKNLLFITNARDLKEKDYKEKQKIAEYVDFLESIGFSVFLLDLKNYFGKTEELFSILDKYDSYCVTGGNVFVLNMAMKLSGFDRYLRGICKDDNKIYIGWSAGSCVLTDNLEGLNLVDEAINPYTSDLVSYEGVGLLNYSIVPHYKSVHKESTLIDDVVCYMEENKRKYIAISDGEVIIDKV